MVFRETINHSTNNNFNETQSHMCGDPAFGVLSLIDSGLTFGNDPHRGLT